MKNDIRDEVKKRTEEARAARLLADAEKAKEKLKKDGERKRKKVELEELRKEKKKQQERAKKDKQNKLQAEKKARDEERAEVKKRKDDEDKARKEVKKSKSDAKKRKSRGHFLDELDFETQNLSFSECPGLPSSQRSSLISHKKWWPRDLLVSGETHTL